jgi:hypothetical protein
MMIPDVNKKYNEEILPSVKSMNSDLNINASQKNTLVTTRAIVNPSNENIIECFRTKEDAGHLVMT